MARWAVTCGALLLAMVVVHGGIAANSPGAPKRALGPERVAHLESRGEPEDPVEIPFRYVGGQVMLEVGMPDGSQVWMNLDSGVFPSVVDTSLVQRLGLSVSGAAGSIAGMGSRTITYRRAVLPTVTLGAFVVRDLPIIATEVTHLSTDLPMSGTLGESFFRRAKVEIDYPNRVVRLWSIAHADDVGDGTSLEADVSGVTPRLELDVNGQRVSGWIDTGAQPGLLFSEATARSLGLGDALANAQTVGGMGTRGAFVAKLLTVDSVKVGGSTVYDVRAVVMPVGPVLVGNEIWDDFALTLDYEHGWVKLKAP